MWRAAGSSSSKAQALEGGGGGEGEGGGEGGEYAGHCRSVLQPPSFRVLVLSEAEVTRSVRNQREPEGEGKEPHKIRWVYLLGLRAVKIQKVIAAQIKKSTI